MSVRVLEGDALAGLATLPDESVDTCITSPPYYGLRKYGENEGELHEGDCLDVLRTLPERSIDVCITDPPYALGFMGQHWDASLPDLAVWTELYRVLRPGAHLAAFGATRTWHRLGGAVEDAGFEVRDSLAWLYGTGFPKTKNGSEGRGTALKPAWEPILLARVPLEGTHEANEREHGTGYLNIDEARIPIPSENDVTPSPRGNLGDPGMFGGRGDGEEKRSLIGRWPANVVTDGSEAVKEELPHVASGKGDANGRIHAAAQGPEHPTHTFHNRGKKEHATRAIGDEGNASRFFYTAKPSTGEKEAGLTGDGSIHPHRRAGAHSTVGRAATMACPPPLRRNVHATVKPVELMRWLVRLLTPPGGTVLDPFLGSGTTAIAAVLEDRAWLGIEREPAYAAIARQRIVWWTAQHARKSGRTVAQVLEEDAPRAKERTEHRDQMALF